ncbi:MAG: aryl-sulfate sulfotransferase [Myxococcales bacterium]|nr:aryl-sulfate sulfotransferase [Myxococcales bacterium]
MRTPSHSPRLLASLALACACACSPEDDPEDTSETDAGDAAFLVLPRLTIGPNASVPLVGVLEFETAGETRARVELDDGARRWTVEFAELARAHKHPLLGLRPDREHTVTLTLIDAQGEETPGPTLVGATAPLPADFPAMTVHVAEPERMEPGYTLINVPVPRGLGGGGYIIGLDARGEVVWLHRSSWRVEDSQRLRSGNTLVLQAGFYRLYELDVYGELVGSWYASNIAGLGDEGVPVPADTFHHEVFASEQDTFIALSTELRAQSGFPLNEPGFPPSPSPTDLVGTVVVEFTRGGAVVQEWSVLDQLDPLRISYGTYEGDFYGGVYPASTLAVDWDHSNGVTVDPADGGVILSLRHQDAVAKFSRDGALRWVLAPPENWDPALAPYLLTPESPEFRFTYQQHAPMLTPTGTLLLFDNALYQASPPAPSVADTVSRAVEFELDLEAMSVRQVWQYGEGGELGHAPWVGDADWLPTTGNILVAAAGLKAELEGEPSMRVVEVTHAQPAERVFEVTVDDDNPNGPANRVGNQAERVADLYPPWAGATTTWLEGP